MINLKQKKENTVVMRLPVLHSGTPNTSSLHFCFALCGCLSEISSSDTKKFGTEKFRSGSELESEWRGEHAMDRL